jgi:hypothetical protein
VMARRTTVNPTRYPTGICKCDNHCVCLQISRVMS